MDAWETLVATALVGTDRQTPAAPGGETAVTTLVDQLDWHQPEQALLGAAGAIALHRQIGQQPLQPNWPTVEPCALDDLPGVSTAIARHLDTAMNTYPEVLPELLSLIAQAGQRLPERQLPRLLQMGQQTSALRPYVAAVGGQRGQWLAAQQTDWSYARVGGAHGFSLDSPQLQDIWANGRRSERLLLWQRWREAAPAAAREALEAVWTTESAKNREAFINGLATNLTMADEPFLEAALSDRAKGVRRAAIELLVRLPPSRLCQRMAAYIAPLVQLTDSGQTLQIAVTLPASYDPDWERDGVPAKAQAGQGERGGWLEAILAATSLEIWGDPTAVVRALRGHPWQAVLIPGWGMAAHRQQRADWAEAFLNDSEPPLANDVLLGQLLALLTPFQQEQWLRARLPTRPSAEDVTRWLLLVIQSAQRWDLAFSQLILEQLTTLVKDRSRVAYSLAYETRNLRLTLHPDLVPTVAIALEEVTKDANSPRHWESSLLELLKYLNFRREMHRAFPASE